MSSIMAAAAAVQSQTRAGIQAVVIRQEVKAQQALVALLSESAAASAPAAPGTGQVVDRRA